MLQKVKNFFTEEQGGGLVEHTLILVLISLAVVATMTTVGSKISGDMTTITGKL